MPSYKRRRDMVPGDVYYWEPANDDSVCLLVQVLDRDTEVNLENRDGGYIDYSKFRSNISGADGFFTPYRIFEMVEES